MALTIDNPEVEKLVRELAAETGATVDEAVALAVREQLARRPNVPIDPHFEMIRERKLREPRPDPETIRAAIREFRAEIAKLPVLDPRSPDEILGYDEFGLPR